jgi:galactokinase
MPPPVGCSAPVSSSPSRRSAVLHERQAAIGHALGTTDDVRWHRAPGRVNLIGDHTDYNDGLVLPMTIDRDCLIGWRPRADGILHVRSIDLPGTCLLPADGGEHPDRVQPPWLRYVAGVARALAVRGRSPAGIDAVVGSTVPPGSGLSSSAALSVSTALALCEAADLAIGDLELASACQRAEHLATGVPCGIMDPLVSAAGRSDAAVLIDCRTLEITPVELPSSLAVLVVHSGVERALAGSAYAERRAACEQAAARLGVASLRDASPEAAAEDPFARHVVSENARVLAACEALRGDDRAALARIFAESHASLRDDFRVSTAELDALVGSLLEAGAIAARPTGAGFGGCVVALVDSGAIRDVSASACARYRSRTGLEPTAIVCTPSPGAGPA